MAGRQELLDGPPRQQAFQEPRRDHQQQGVVAIRDLERLVVMAHHRQLAHQSLSLDIVGASGLLHRIGFDKVGGPGRDQEGFGLVGAVIVRRHHEFSDLQLTDRLHFPQLLEGVDPDRLVLQQFGDVGVDAVQQLSALADIWTRFNQISIASCQRLKRAKLLISKP